MKYHSGAPGTIAKERYDDLFSAPPEYITADVETPTTTDVTPLGIGLCTPRGDAFYFPLEPEVEPGIPWHLFTQETNTKVIWYNAPFDLDYRSFGQYLDKEDLLKTEDAIICSRYQGFDSNSLDYVSGWAGIQHQSANMGDVLEEHRPAGKAKNKYTVRDLNNDKQEVVAKKCLDDVLATKDVWEWLRPRIPDEYYYAERDFLRTLLYMGHIGVKKDDEQLDRLSRELEAERLRLRGFTDYYGFNPNSAFEVCTMLNEDNYWLPMTPKGNPITKRSVLEKIPHPVAQLTILSKQYDKLLGSYIRKWMKEDRIHSRFKMDGTTGRTSSEDYAMQNIPKGDRQGAIKPKAGNLRTIFIPDTDWGTKWDLKQIELRVLAWLSGDPEMLKILNSPDGDLHQETMKMFASFGYYITRTEAKNFNFGMIYGGSPEVLATYTKIKNIALLQQGIDAWALRFPIAWAWIERQKKQGLKDLTVYTAFGRKLNIGTSAKGVDSVKHIENCAVCWPIQGTAAEIFKRVSNAMTDFIIPRECHRSQIHDEFWESGLWEIPDWMEYLVPGIWTPMEIEYVQNYGQSEGDVGVVHARG